MNQLLSSFVGDYFIFTMTFQDPYQLNNESHASKTWGAYRAATVEDESGDV